VPSGKENLDNNFLSKEEKTYFRLANNIKSPFKKHENSFAEIKLAIENLKKNNN
jgi:hypothetical protein